MTDKSVSKSSTKMRKLGSGLDHARFDLWLLPDVRMHATNSKKDLFNDTKTDLIIACKYGSLIVDVSDIKKPALVRNIYT